MSLILINQALGNLKMCFSGSRPTEFPFIHPPLPQWCPKMGFSPCEPGRALQVPTPPYFGGAGFNYEPNSHQPSARTSQNAFFRVQTDRISVYPPPPPNGAENGFFHLVSPAGHFTYPPPPILGVLNSIMRLILINQALGHLKMFFSRSRPTEYPFIHPAPPTVPKMGFFTS